MFRDRVTRLANRSRRRAARSVTLGPPWTAGCLVPSSSATTDRSTAGATNGATQIGTPSRCPSAKLFPKPNRKVNATTTPTIAVTSRVEASGIARNSGHLFDWLDDVAVGGVTGHRPWSGPG